MSYPVYTVPAGDTLPVLFSTFAGSTGAPITMTGFAVTDIEVYKDGSATQRASDSGYTLLDTDGTDFDGITGIHGFSIDTSDNSDAGYYTTGAWFHVVISTVTVDSQTMSFVACAFRIVAAENSAGVPATDATHISGDSTTSDRLEQWTDSWVTGTAQAGAAGTITLAAGASATDDFHNGSWVFISSGTGSGQGRKISDYVGSTKVATIIPNWATNPDNTSVYVIIPEGLSVISSTNPIPANIVQVSDDSTAATNLESMLDGTGGVTLTTAITGNITGNLSGSVGSVTGAVGSVTGNVGGNVTGSVGSVTGLTASDVAAIKAKTDSLTFTQAGHVDANVQRINDVAITGDGSATPYNV